MITKLKLDRDDKGNITAEPSEYKPSDAIKDRTKMVMADFESSDLIQSKAYQEFNEMSLTSRMSLDQKSFNTYQEPKSDDPSEAWKSNAVRPIARNKVVSIAAHITGAVIFPQIYAQNENDEEDKDAADVMRDLIVWAADRCDYVKTFLYGVIAALVNPGACIHQEYCEQYREVKKIKDDGKWDKEIVLDELLSGFQQTSVPLDELFIADAYEPNIQKQPYLIWRRVIDYRVAERKHGANDSFRSYVRPGIQRIFDDGSQTFYDMADENLSSNQVEEVIYYNRNEDLQLNFVNGVLLSDPDQPNPRLDKRYPFAFGGYETFDEGRFFYKKSLVNKIGPDKDLIDRMYRYVMDGSIQELWPSMTFYGNEAINSDVTIPGSVNRFKDPNSKLERTFENKNLMAGYNALEKLEASVSESSQDPRQSGQDSKGSQTAFEVARLEQNAKIQLGMFGKMIGFLVKDLSDLMISDIIQHLTVADVMETAGEGSRVKFRNFIIPDKVVGGKRKTRKIVLDGELPDTMSDKDLNKRQWALLKEEMGPRKDFDAKTQIVKVNPSIFRRLKFLIKVQPEMEIPQSDAIRKLLNLEVYDRAIANPLANQEAIFRDLLLGSYETTKDDPDKYINKQQPLQSLLANQLNKAPLAEKPINKVVGDQPKMALQL